MGVTTTQTNKPLNPRGNDQSPLAFNRAKLFSGKALDFDGVNDNVDLAGFTMSGINASFVFNLKADSWGALDYIFDLSPNRLVFGANSGNDISIYDSSAWLKFADFSDTTNTNNFVLTIEGTTAKLYLNGQSFGNTLTLSTNIDLSATTEFALMSARNFTGNFFNGQLSGFKIFNTALTAAQIADLYNNPEKVVPTGVDNTALKLWLPMQEGAGTTAYDGSGNGNHGTISGATYTHGIGAPVSQTAVIDWNKGVNILDNSENFSGWTTETGTTITSDSIAAPDGLTTADTISSAVSSQINQHQVVSPVTSGANYVFSVWLKKKTTSEIQIYLFSASGGSGFRGRATINFDSGTITDVQGSGATIEEYPNGWFRCAVYATTDSTTLSHGIYTDVAGVADVYAWGGQSEQSDTLGPYVPTFGTAQTSPVLLPQGLTTGRDITGVNLFENVRKQGALNLDGNSWAEVHDNASLDFGTGSFTLEAWAKVKYVNQGSSYNVLFNLGGNLGSTNTACLSTDASGNFVFFYGASGTSSGALTEGDWVHIVGVYDGINAIVYADGVKVVETARTPINITNALSKKIGTDETGSRYYTEPIAQPRIYNRALTAEEVQRNYNAGKNIYTN